MTFTTFLLVMAVLLNHGFADFLLQNHNMATQKSKSIYWLTIHVLVYTAGMIPLAILVLIISGKPLYGIIWLLGNGAAHWMTDYYTSKWTSKLYDDQQFYSPNKYLKFVNFPSFFSVIEMDQCIHYICLFGSLTMLI